MDIINFLRTTMLPPLSKLERVAGIPATTLSAAIKGKRDIPGKHLPALKKVLKNYGYREK